MCDPSEQMALTIVDTTGIQAYIFGTNTLRHHMGASWLVDWATQGAVYETVLELRDDIQANIDKHGVIDSNRRIEDRAQTLDVELLYSGGGNAILIFRQMTEAHTFTQKLTYKLLKAAPGLQVVVTHIDFDWEHEVLASKLSELRKAANRKKNERYPSMPLLGLGVTADCQFIDLPAEVEEKDGDGRPLRISGEVSAKLSKFNDACQRLVKEVRDGLPGDRALPENVEFIYDFDEIGSPGESSFLAVVHIDGNGMGQRFQAIANAHQTPMQNREYVKEIRRLSNRVREIAKAALCSTVLTLQRSREQDENGKETISGKIPLRHIKGQIIRLPFRPIVYGGDDVTFVCDGRLGLTLAAHYLQAMEKSFGISDNNGDDQLYVRAGVAVVNNHYPFSRAYQLAEQLADSAKESILKISPEKRVSALDWHFAINGLALSLKELRQRDYQTTDGSLLIRPLLLNNYDGFDNWRTWSFFAKVMENLLENSDWGNSRNKVIGYGEALRNGYNATRQFLKAYVKPDTHLYVPGESIRDKNKNKAQSDELSPDVQAKIAQIRACGWYDEHAVHYDAVEAFDFFVRLQPDATDTSTPKASATEEEKAE